MYRSSSFGLLSIEYLPRQRESSRFFLYISNYACSKITELRLKSQW